MCLDLVKLLVCFSLSQLSGGSGDSFPEVAFVILRQFYQRQQDFLLSFMSTAATCHLLRTGCVWGWGGEG